MNRVLVTGANGFIGKALIKALTEKKYEVVALDVRFDSELQNNIDVTCINVADINVFDIKEFIPDGGYDCMFLLAWAGVSGIGRANYELQLQNVKLVCDYVKFCSNINCKRVIYASSITEMETYEYLQSDDAEPSGSYVYGAGKLAAHLMGETIAKQNGVEFIPVIITNIYGAGEKSERMIYTSIKKLINKEHCSFTEGHQIYDFIYIIDAVNAMVAVAEKGKPFNRYYIGSGEPKPLREFLLEMRDVVDPTAELGLGDIPFKGVDISYNQFDLKKVERETGYKNTVSFVDGINLTANFIKNWGGART